MSEDAQECPGCDGRGWNAIAVHAPDCDGSCRQCPVQEQEQCATCGWSGEVVRMRADAQADDKFPEGDAHGPICGDPCPEAPDLEPCLMVPGHYGPWHRNRSSAWPVAEKEEE